MGSKELRLRCLELVKENNKFSPIDLWIKHSDLLYEFILGCHINLDKVADVAETTPDENNY